MADADRQREVDQDRKNTLLRLTLLEQEKGILEGKIKWEIESFEIRNGVMIK
jgi:hypothetical protein